MWGRWIWVLAYLLVAAAILGVGAGLAALPLFRQTPVPQLPQLQLAQLVWAGAVLGALFVIWSVGRRLALQFYRGGLKQAYAGDVILPLWTTLVLALAGEVALRHLLPLLGVRDLEVARWLSIAAVGAAALWFCAVLVRSLPSLIDVLKSGFLKRLVQAARRCRDCGTPIVEGGRFCYRCGAAG